MAKKSRRSARSADDTDAAAVETGVDDRRSQTERDNEEAMARMDNARPTPTQEENDLAKVGALDLSVEKEDHGGEDEGEAIRRRMMARAGSPMPYQNRQVKSEE
jgi:hypothetical protein